MSLKFTSMAVFMLALLCLVTGCASTSTSDTKRTGKELLLVSNAVDRSLDKIDFQSFQRTKIFVNEKYLESVDSKYIVGSIRHRVLASNAILVDKADQADYILEVRSGGVGTDNHDTFIGMPKLQLPGPLPISIPEIRLWSRTQQTGMAKIGIVAFDAKSNQIMGQGGTTLAKSDDSNTYVMGLGPWQSGTIHDEVKFATAQKATTATVFFAPKSKSLSTRNLARQSLPRDPEQQIQQVSQEKEEEESKSNNLSINPFR